MYIAAAALTSCQPHVEVHQQGMVARVHADNGTLAPLVKM